MYIPREVEGTIDRMLSQGKVVLLTGARQVGKTTVLKEHLGSDFGYITLEDPALSRLAERDAALFFDTHELPLIVDEVQRAPGLLSAVKLVVDSSEAKGRIVLTGSQTYHLMQGVSESLAGRVRIIEMAGLTLRELTGHAGDPRPFVPAPIRSVPPDALDTDEVWHRIHRGSMPELADESIDWDAFYADYERTYLERDVRDLVRITDESRFFDFMVAIAARSGCLFNAADIAGVVGIDPKTARSWLSVLEASGTVRLLRPFWPNVGKRLTKMPKLFFMDTGLVCHLTRWTGPEELRRGAAAGRLFETFVVSEVLKSWLNAGANVRDVWFFRDARKREIDLVIQRGHTLHPVEVKTASVIRDCDFSSFACLDAIEGCARGFGHVVCQTQSPVMLDENVQAVGVWAL